MRSGSLKGPVFDFDTERVRSIRKIGGEIVGVLTRGGVVHLVVIVEQQSAINEYAMAVIAREFKRGIGHAGHGKGLCKDRAIVGLGVGDEKCLPYPCRAGDGGGPRGMARIRRDRVPAALNAV